jgi:hypothetical protein
LVRGLTAWGGSRADEFLLAIAEADVSCPTGNDFAAAMSAVPGRFQINAPLEDVIDQHFWIEVRAHVMAVRGS